jgi:hypothetical protein
MRIFNEPEADMLRLSRTDGNALHGNLRTRHRALVLVCVGASSPSCAGQEYAWQTKKAAHLY